jgi:hypothetical protein
MNARWLWVGLVCASGCASVGNVQRADTVGKGNYQVGLEPGVQFVSQGGTTVPYPHLDASFRFGVGDGVDLGLRAGWSFLEAQGKFLLTKPGNPGVIASLAPTLGGIFLGVGAAGAGFLHFALPALIGIPVGEHELVIGPRIQGYYAFAAAAGAGSAGALVLAPGSTIGFAFQVTESVAIMPEFGLVVPVVGSVGATGVPTMTGTSLGGGVLGQFKLGILVGKKRKRPLDADLTPPPPPPPGVGPDEPPPVPVR